MMKTKICSRCKEKKPVSEFPKDKSKKSGIRPSCKACKNAYGRIYGKKYYIANKESMNKKSQAWSENNVEAMSKIRAKYNIRNIDVVRKYQRELSRRYVEDLSDTYIVAQLSSLTGLSRATIRANPELIELKRFEKRCKRYVKQNK